MPGQGWMPGVVEAPTEAYGYADVAAGSMVPIAVMSHIMQGYQPTMVAWANERPRVTPKSAHFTVGRTGDVIQHVGIYDPAWAAGRVADPTWRLLPADASTADSTPNKLCVHIEHEGFSVPPQYGYDYLYDETHAWPQPMVQSSIEVQRWCLGELGVDASADAVIGHFMTDGVSRADDPGSAWPRQRILAELGAADLPQELTLLNPRWPSYGQALGRYNGHRVTPLRRDARFDYYELRLRRRD